MSPADTDHARRGRRRDMEPLPPRRVLAGLGVVVVVLVLIAGYDGLRRREVEVPWRLVRSDATSTVVLIEVQTGGCREFKRVEVEETSERVALSVWSPGPRKWGGEDCAAIASFECRAVELARPLGPRAIDGAAPGRPEFPDLCDRPRK